MRGENLLVGSLAATAAATTNPLLPRQTPDCSAQILSIYSTTPDPPEIDLIWWLRSAVADVAAAATTPFKLCQVYDVQATLTAPPSLASAWSSYSSATSAFKSSHRDEILDFMSRCATVTATTGSVANVAGMDLELAIARDRRDCEAFYKKYEGYYESEPLFPGSTTSNATLSLGFTTTGSTATTSNTGVSGVTRTTGESTTTSTTSTSTNGAVRETGYVGIAAVAVLGAVAML